MIFRCRRPDLGSIIPKLRCQELDVFHEKQAKVFEHRCGFSHFFSFFHLAISVEVTDDITFFFSLFSFSYLPAVPMGRESDDFFSFFVIQKVVGLYIYHYHRWPSRFFFFFLFSSWVIRGFCDFCERL